MKVSLTTYILTIIVVVLICTGVMFAKLNEQDEKIAKLNENINKLEQFESEYEDENQKVVEEKEIGEFIAGVYTYDYVEIMEEGEETEWELEFSMGFIFNNDGTVYGSLPGHESGGLDGTYELSGNEIKCKFTEFENECSATYGVKLEQEGELVLNRLNENELSIIKWMKNPKLDGIDLSYGEGKIFTINR